jgi:pilus assembly protein Flp/PilA
MYRKTEKAQGLVEYALILVLVAVVVIAILTLLGPSISGVFQNIVDSIGTAGSGSSAGMITFTCPNAPNNSYLIIDGTASALISNPSCTAGSQVQVPISGSGVPSGHRIVVEDSSYNPFGAAMVP